VLYKILADAVLLLHLAFILFVVFGGLLALRWRRIAWVHLPAACWGAAVEVTGWICPLTPLENRLRLSAGAQAYRGSFLEHYLVPIVYPAGLTPEIQVALGVALVVGNGAIYAAVWRRRARPGLPEGA
jgi:hypothetical protein